MLPSQSFAFWDDKVMKCYGPNLANRKEIHVTKNYESGVSDQSSNQIKKLHPYFVLIAQFVNMNPLSRGQAAI